MEKVIDKYHNVFGNVFPFDFVQLGWLFWIILIDSARLPPAANLHDNFNKRQNVGQTDNKKKEKEISRILYLFFFLINITCIYCPMRIYFYTSKSQ